jgi:hypothetical protein
MSRVVELVFKGTNRSAIKALDDIAVKSDRTAKKVGDSSKRASRSYDDMGRSATRLRGIVGGLAGTVGFGGLAIGIKDAVQGAVSLNSAQTQLRNSLTGAGASASSAQRNVKALTDQYDAMGQRAGANTEQLVGGLAKLVGVTHNVGQAQQGQRAALALATKTGMDYNSALQLIVSAEAGRTRGIQKYIGIITPATSNQQALADQARQHTLALQAQAKTMGKAGPAWLAQQRALDATTKSQSAAATAADKQATAQQVVNRVLQFSAGAHESLAQRAADAKAHLHDLVTEFGEAFLPIVSKGINVVSKLVGSLSKHRTVMYALLGVVGATTAILTAHAAVMAVVEAKNIALAATNRLLGTSFGEAAAGEEGASAASLGLGAAMDTIPIFALIAGVVLIATHFKQFKAIVSDVWHFIKSHDWILLLIPGIGPLLFGIEQIATHFQQVKQVAASVANGIVTAFHAVAGFLSGAATTVWNALTWPFRKAWQLISGVFDKIKKGVQAIAGLPGKVFGGVTHFLGGLFSRGGPVTHARYFASGGPSGSDTVPAWLTPGEGVLNKAAMSRIGAGGLNALNAGQGIGGGDITIEPGVAVFKLDGRVLAQAVVNYTLRRGARGPSSLVGGSLATGAVALGTDGHVIGSAT